MNITPLSIPDVKLIDLAPIGDSRGLLVETYGNDAYCAAGIDDLFVQDLITRSTEVHTLRGLHFQAPPSAQAKLVRVARGRILDVVVDLRRASGTFGQHVAVELSEDRWQQLYVPVGFAHGFCTLERETEIVYKLSHGYDGGRSFGLKWDDTALGIDWPVAAGNAILSERDQGFPGLADLPAYFD